MTEIETRVMDQVVAAAEGWSLEWVDRATGVARLRSAAGMRMIVVEGEGSDWVVTLRGRRIAVTARTWRERLFAEAEVSAGGQGGPIEVRATLPGLVVAVETADGAEVAAGDALLTIEAMKMQNEVRAPRAGRISALVVVAGEPVTKGQLLLRLE